MTLREESRRSPSTRPDEAARPLPPLGTSERAKLERESPGDDNLRGALDVLDKRHQERLRKGK